MSGPGKAESVCQQCGLYRECMNPFLKMEMPQQAQLMLVGEKPHADDDVKGRVFSSESGQTLRRIVDIPCGYASAVRCHPNGSGLTRGQVGLCGRFLMDDIDRVNPRIVVLMGEMALQAAMGYRDLETWRGKLLEKGGRYYLPTWDMDSIRGEKMQTAWLEDLDRAMQIAQGEKDKPDNFYQQITTIEQALSMFAELMAVKRCVCVFQNTVPEAYHADRNAISVITFAIPHKTWSLPLYHPDAPWTNEERLALRVLLEKWLDGNVEKVGYDLKMLAVVSHISWGVDVWWCSGDVLLLSQLLDSRGPHTLKALAKEYLNYDYVYPPKPSLDDLCKTLAIQARIVRAVEPILLEKLDRRQLALYQQSIIPSIRAFQRIEGAGMAVDVPLAVDYVGRYQKTTLDGTLTDAYDQTRRFLERLPDWIGDDGNIRSYYEIVGTKTGRTSTNEPNLQGLIRPDHDKYAGSLLQTYPIRNILRSRWKDGCLLVADYKAMDMRILAALSNAQAMRAMFEAKQDIHTYVAARVYHIAEDRVTEEMRSAAKAANFMLIYGGNWSTLVKQYQIDPKEAKNLEFEWHALFPEVSEYYQDQTQYVREHGYATSPFGRRRYLPDIENNDPKIRRKAERQAANHPIQSASRDVMTLSMILLNLLIEQHGMQSREVHDAHDSVVVDVAPKEWDTLYPMTVDIMTNLVETYTPEYFSRIDLSWLTVPLEITVTRGERYGSPIEVVV